MDLLEYLSQKIVQSDNWVQKTQYRRDLLKAVINSYPAGTPIKPREMAVLLGYRPDASSVFTFLAKLIQKGEISRQEVRGSKSYAYTVLKPGNTYDKERSQLGQVGQVTEVAVDKQTNKEGEYLMEKTYTFGQLEDLAMKFQFYNYGLSMTVAQFLEKLKEV